MNWDLCCPIAFFSLNESIFPRPGCMEVRPSSKGRQEQRSKEARESPTLAPSSQPLTLMGKNIPLCGEQGGGTEAPSGQCASFSFLRGGRAWAKMEFSGISCDPHDPQLFCSQKPTLPIIYPPTLF